VVVIVTFKEQGFCMGATATSPKTSLEACQLYASASDRQTSGRRVRRIYMITCALRN
jgi:hypothetical protein